MRGARSRAGRSFAQFVGWLALCLLLPAAACRAAPVAAPLVLTADTAQATLAGHLARHVDPDGRLGVDEIARSAAFEPLPGFSTGGYSAAAQWYRVTVARTAQARADWVLELGQAYLDDVRVYLPQAAGGFSEVRLGRMVPYAQRPLPTRLHTLRLHLPDTQPRTLYVRVASISTLSFFGEVWDPDAFIGKETRGNFVYGGYFGMLLLSIVMYAVLGSWLRDASLLAYTLYVVTLFVSYLTLNGYAAVVFAPDDPRWLVALTGLGSMTGTVTAILMWDRFLDLGRHMPRVHRAMRVWAGLLIPGMFSVVSPAYRVFANVSNGSAALLTLVVLPGIALAPDSRPLARRYVCVAAQSAWRAARWERPGGWHALLRCLTDAGYEVVCIDSPSPALVDESSVLARDAHGLPPDLPWVERARWLRHAECFIGVPGDLPWLAWAVGTPAVLIGGFTHPVSEFGTAHRVMNGHACNSCWNDPGAAFDEADPSSCPRHAGTLRQFECARLISVEQVKHVLRAIPGIAC